MFCSCKIKKIILRKTFHSIEGVKKIKWNKAIAVAAICVTGCATLFGTSRKVNADIEKYQSASQIQNMTSTSTIKTTTTTVAQVKMSGGKSNAYTEKAYIHLAGYASTGEKVWEKKVTVPNVSDGVCAYSLGMNGSQYYYSDLDGIHALNVENGKELWNCEMTDLLKEAVFGKDGTLYGCGELDIVFCAISKDGQKLKEILLFSNDDDDEFPSIKSVAEDHVEVEVETEGDKQVYAVDLKDYHYYPVMDSGKASVSMDGQYYASVQDAMDASEGTDTYIKIWDNIAEDIIVSENEDITIDLNGYTLSNVSDHTITNYGTLTIYGDGYVDNTTNEKAALVNMPQGKAYLMGGTFFRSKEDGVEGRTNNKNTYYTVQNYGEMNIDGATVKNAGSYSTALHNGWPKREKNQDEKFAHMTLSDGSIEGGVFAVKNDMYGVAKINGGTLSGGHQAVMFNKSIIDVNGGVFEDSPIAIVNHGKSGVSDQCGKCTVTGGTFNTKKFNKLGDGAPKIIDRRNQEKSEKTTGTVKKNKKTTEVVKKNTKTTDTVKENTKTADTDNEDTKGQETDTVVSTVPVEDTDEATNLSEAEQAYEEFENAGIVWDEYNTLYPEDCEYKLVYIDDDDVPELLVKSFAPAHASGWGRIYYYKDGEVRLLDEIYSSAFYYEKTGIYCRADSGAGGSEYYYVDMKEHIKNIESGESAPDEDSYADYDAYREAYQKFDGVKAIKDINDMDDPDNPTFTYEILQDDAYMEVDEETFNSRLKELVGNSQPIYDDEFFYYE